MTRTEFGFTRTIRGGWEEVLNCQYLPGFLVAADIERMAAACGAVNVLAWAKQHLLASPGATVMDGEGNVFNIPTLVPARQPCGHCVFLSSDSMCGIHEASPFGCAFVDTTMTREQADERSHAAIHDVLRSWRDRDDGYADLWEVLHNMGRVSPPAVESRLRMAMAYERGPAVTPAHAVA
jgi:hypothetical protein